MQQVEIIKQKDCYILKLSGSFSGGLESNHLKETLLDIAAKENKVYLDMQEVEYLTSIIIGMFVAANNKLQANGGSIYFYRPNAYINELFNMTRLTDIIDTRFTID